ncbi:MAG: EAL domain-containing protein [Acidobacteria bacterium]|nr:EAL domain-containing protein [Acidobacteriota bacterium]
MIKGTGLNSIPIRFALMTAVFAVLCISAQLYLWVHVGYDAAPRPLIVLVLGAAITVPTSITYLAARKLTTQIRAMWRSTEAIADGDFNRPVDVDCACEVGGLADSFRRMVGRLNSNILRMNMLAYSDTVTGLPNRVVITHVLRHFTSTERPGHGALLFIDLDGFKTVNDTLGHRVGDEVLRQASRRIIHRGLDRTIDQLDTCTTPFGELCHRPPEDIVFVRFAGDEFVALLPNVTDRQTLETRATAILESLEEPFTVEGHEIRIGASIGIVRAPDDSADSTELLNFADLAMYAAKQAGKGRRTFFSPELHAVAVERAGLEADLRRALEHEDLTLHYQPKLDSRTLDCAGFEALARWDHPTRGPIEPATFVPIAEQAGLMPALGAHVMRLAVRQCRAWLDAGVRRSVAINVSPAQFQNPHLVAEILAVLRDHGVPAEMIELEITESMIMSDFTSTKDRMEKLQAAGILISVDDFGIGFSNLSQIARLPFNTLKIDRSLVADIGINAKSESIVKAIVGMAHALGHQTIAEGIETPVQHHFLQQIGCDRLQGFMFGRPMPAADIDAWERERRRRGHAACDQTIAKAG